MRAIEIRDLSFAYEGSERLALDGVSLDVERGEFVVIAGPSGCGKSTLIKAINGLIPSFYGGSYKGEVRIEGHNPAKEQPHELFKVVGTVFQEPDTQLLTFSVERELAFPLENSGVSRTEMKELVEDALNRFGLSHLRHRSPSELSGGEQQRVAIAVALISKPSVLLLDEPTSSLDPRAAVEVLSVVHELNRSGMTVVISEHRLSLLLPFAHKLVVMNQGRIVDQGPPSEVILRMANQGLVEVPDAVAAYLGLKELGIRFDRVPMDARQFLDEVRSSTALMR
ncbi:MAG TPA: ABC transporter ATP-binding protein [Thermoprotei archaeon]|nr:ABC transporter ATP-binding protein [Thermoprotei archaeon]